MFPCLHQLLDSLDLGGCSLLKLSLRTQGQGKSSNLASDKQAACLFIFIIAWFQKRPLSEYTQDKRSAFARLQGSQVCPGPPERGDRDTDFQNRKVTDPPSCPAFSPASEDTERRKVPRGASGERVMGALCSRNPCTVSSLTAGAAVRSPRLLSSSDNAQHLQSAESFLPPKMTKPVSPAALGTHVEMSPGNTCEIRVWDPMQDLQLGQEPLDACPWGAGTSSPPACSQRVLTSHVSLGLIST